MKGLALRALDSGFVALYGEAARDAAIERMPREIAEAFRYRTLLAASWYPLAWYGEILAAYRASQAAGLDLCRRVGHAGARSQMLGSYRAVIARLLTPDLVLRAAARFFGSFFDTGSVEVIELRAGRGRVAFRDCTGWDENMWTEMLGALQGFLEIAGAKDVRGRIVRGGRTGDTHCEMEGTWG